MRSPARFLTAIYVLPPRFAQNATPTIPLFKVVVLNVQSTTTRIQIPVAALGAVQPRLTLPTVPTVILKAMSARPVMLEPRRCLPVTSVLMDMRLIMKGDAALAVSIDVQLAAQRQMYVLNAILDTLVIAAKIAQRAIY